MGLMLAIHMLNSERFPTQNREIVDWQLEIDGHPEDICRFASGAGPDVSRVILPAKQFGIVLSCCRIVALQGLMSDRAI